MSIEKDIKYVKIVKNVLDQEEKRIKSEIKKFIDNSEELKALDTRIKEAENELKDLTYKRMHLLYDYSDKIDFDKFQSFNKKLKRIFDTSYQNEKEDLYRNNIDFYADPEHLVIDVINNNQRMPINARVAPNNNTNDSFTKRLFRATASFFQILSGN